MTAELSIEEEPVKVYFLGSGALGVPVMRALAASRDIELVGLGTQPDRPSGRHRHLHATPLAEAAGRDGLQVNKPASVNAPEFLNHLRKLSPDMVVVVAFGQLLKAPLLELPRHGCLNVHASLLPKYRGAAPIQAAILAGDQETGVSFMDMDAGLDTGPVYRVVRQPLSQTETTASLEESLAALAGEHIVEVVTGVAGGRMEAVAQDSNLATRAGKIRKSEGIVDWTRNAETLARQARAFHPWPGSFFFLPKGRRNLRVQIVEARAVATGSHGFVPGEVVQADKQGWTIACGQGFLHIFRVVPENRNEMSSEEFLRGARIAVGTVLPLSAGS